MKLGAVCSRLRRLAGGARRRPAGSAARPAKAVRVLLLTAEEGDGHTSVARALAAELAEEGAACVVADALQGGLGRVVPLLSRDAYRLQLRWAAWTYGLEYLVFTRLAPARALARFGLALLGSRPLARMIRRHAPDIVVSTHPAVTAVLGSLRRRGRLRVPVVATITDFGVHPLWSHAGVDVHLVMHESLLASVERVAGPGSARVSRPIVHPRFRAPLPRARARELLGLPANRPLVVVSGGGWGVGRVEEAVRAALRVPGLSIVCVAGRNGRLERRLRAAFTGEERVRVLGFTERMSELLAAADTLVDATVGVTCLEALTRGCRVIVYGAPPGHSRDSARELARLGLAELATSPAQLERSLLGLGRPEPRRAALAAAPAAATVVLGVRPRQPAERRRRAVAVAFAATVATLGLAGFAFGSTAAYDLVSRTLRLQSLSRVDVAEPAVGLVIRAPAPALPRLAAVLLRRRARASFALSDRPGGDVARALAAARAEVLPVLPVDDPARWPRIRRDLECEARPLGPQGRLYFVAPPSGLTLGGYLLAHSVGGVPVVGAVRLDRRHPLDPGRLQAGEIVLVTLDASPAAAATLGRLLTVLATRGLHAVSVSALVALAERTARTADERASRKTPTATARSERASAARTGVPIVQLSPVRSGASDTGTIVLATATTGAARVAGAVWSADISLRVPTPAARPMAGSQTSSPAQAEAETSSTASFVARPSQA
jgi:processive 1,2-diacylglycerol beta-glucosyltransferase